MKITILMFFMAVLMACSLSPGQANEESGMTTATMCVLQGEADTIFGVRYNIKPPAIFFEPHCNYARMQYYKDTDYLWIHSARLNLHVKGNLNGDHEHYGMDINELESLLKAQHEASVKLEKSKGKWEKTEISRTKKNGMNCLRVSTTIRGYLSGGYMHSTAKNYMSYEVSKKLSYYCWKNADEHIPYILFRAESYSDSPLSDEAVERFLPLRKSNERYLRLTDEQDIYKDVEVGANVDLENEIMKPLFQHLVVKDVSEE